MAGWIVAPHHGSWAVTILGANDTLYPHDWGSGGHRIRSDFSRMYAVVSGTGTVADGDRTLLLAPGRIYLFSPRCHALYRAAGPLHLAWVHFRLELAPGIDALAGIPAAAASATPADIAAFRGIAGGQPAATPALELTQAATLAALTARFLPNDWGAVLPRPAERPFAEALAALRADPARTWGLAGLARRAGYHPTYFSNRFRELFGVAPLRFLLFQRLALGRGLLLGGDESIAGIARRCGFADPAWFSRAFRHRYGLAPQQVRRRRDAMDW